MCVNLIESGKCWKCKAKKLELIKTYKDGGGYLRNLYKCKKCGTRLTRIICKPTIKVRMECPSCKQKTLRKAGYYYTRRKPRRHTRFICKNCGKSTSVRQGFARSWDAKVNKRVKILINEKTLFSSKYDNRKIPYYSSRAIKEIIRRRYRINISKSAIAVLIKKFRVFT